MLFSFWRKRPATPPRPVFVIGTGRSGTHWLGYSLANHPEVRSTVEEEPMFGLSKKIALNPPLEDELFDKLVKAYRKQLDKTRKPVYLDKSHPNIWIAERLKAAFPDALFVAIERNPYATVASMMKHRAVSAWHARWREFPLPNRFLGISTEDAKHYDELPLPSQCAKRWVAHHERLNLLRERLGSALFQVSYETFANSPESVIQDLQRFLRLENPLPLPDVKSESLDKWKTQLTAEQIKQIENIVGFPPDAA